MSLHPKPIPPIPEDTARVTRAAFPKRLRTDSTHILAAIRPLNRLECLGEMMRAALNRKRRSSPRLVKS